MSTPQSPGFVHSKHIAYFLSASDHGTQQRKHGNAALRDGTSKAWAPMGQVADTAGFVSQAEQRVDSL